MDLLVTKLRELPDATVATKAFIAIFEQALAILRSPPKGRGRVELRQLVADLGFQFLADLRPRLNPLPERQRKAGYDVVDPNGVATVVKQLTSVESGVRGKLSALADALSADTAARPTCVLVLPGDKTKAGIAAGHFKPLPVPDHLPLVVLDATGDPGRYWCAHHRASTHCGDVRDVIDHVRQVDSVRLEAELEEHGPPGELRRRQGRCEHTSVRLDSTSDGFLGGVVAMHTQHRESSALAYDDT
jgi:hypothetical protein